MDDQKVVIYSTEWCAFCKTLKQYLDSKNVEYVEKNVESDEIAREEMMQKLGGNFQGVPVADFNGEIVVGFDRKKIDELLLK